MRHINQGENLGYKNENKVSINIIGSHLIYSDSQIYA